MHCRYQLKLLYCISKKMLGNPDTLIMIIIYICKLSCMFIVTFMNYPVFQLKTASRSEQFLEECLEFIKDFWKNYWRLGAMTWLLWQPLCALPPPCWLKQWTQHPVVPLGIYHDVSTPGLGEGNVSGTSVIWKLEASTARNIKARSLSSCIQAKILIHWLLSLLYLQIILYDYFYIYDLSCIPA